MVFLISIFFWIAPTLAHSPLPPPSPPRAAVSDAALYLNHYTFNFPHEHAPHLRATRADLGPFIRFALREKMDQMQIGEHHRTFVNFTIWSAKDFQVTIDRQMFYDSARYRIILKIPPDASGRELTDFFHAQFAFLPEKDGVVPPLRLPLRPWGHRPTLWNLCTDWLKYSEPPFLIP